MSRRLIIEPASCLIGNRVSLRSMHITLKPLNLARTFPKLGDRGLHTSGVTASQLSVTSFGVQTYTDSILNMIAFGTTKQERDRHDIVATAWIAEIGIKRMSRHS